MGEKVLIVTGRSKERPVSLPDAHLYRGRAGDGVDCLAAFDKKTVVLSRPVSGLACKIRVSLRQYDAVAVVARDDKNILRLAHRDPGLSIDIAEMDDFDAAEEYRDRLAAFLDLPVLMLAGGRCSAEPVDRAGAKARRNNPVRARRARFLVRRQPGDTKAVRKIEGREIIASA